MNDTNTIKANTAEFNELCEMSERDELLGMYSDMYKDAYNVRPGLRYLMEAELDEIRDAIERLGSEIDRRIDEDKAQGLVNIELCEQRITNIIAMGAGDRATAIRWMHDAEGTNGDPEFLCWSLGVPYGYFNKEH